MRRESSKVSLWKKKSTIPNEHARVDQEKNVKCQIVIKFVFMVN